MDTVLVRNADRMVTSASPLQEGIEVAFADGRRGIIPFAALPEIGELANLAQIELPNPYEIVLRNSSGETVGLPWDFARHYCDASYRPRIETLALSGRKALGARIRTLRESAGMTQETLARAANIGRVTLVRIESAEQSPRFETLVSLAKALGRPTEELLVESGGR